MNHKSEEILYMIGEEQKQAFNHTYQNIGNGVAEFHPSNDQSAFVKLEPQDSLRSPIGNPEALAFKGIDMSGNVAQQAAFKPNEPQVQMHRQQLSHNYDVGKRFTTNSQQHQHIQPSVNPAIHSHYQPQLMTSGNYQIQDHLPPKDISSIIMPDHAHGQKRIVDHNDINPLKVDVSHEDQYSTSRKRSRNSESSFNEGDNELKQLALNASDHTLPELASKIKNQENGDKFFDKSPSTIIENGKERQRQVFGMVWLLKSCESSPTAVVPRNRIYAKYVQVCADNGLSPLSPASFGKLVRISFPNLSTRRLGMRGQSKYHYCGIKLLGETDYSIGQTSSLSTPSNLGMDSPISTNNPNTPLGNSPAIMSDLSTPSSSSVFSEHLRIHPLWYLPNIFPLIEQSLSQVSMSNPVSLPSILPYLPKNADIDIADTLYSLYKVHCNSIFESLRYMQMKKLFSSFVSFNSILTAPVFKLYTSDSVHEWVKKSDLVMYRTMVKMLVKLQLQSIPDDVLQNLKTIANQYLDKLTSSLQGKVPKSFMMMKFNTAKQFITILSRLTKVVETGQLATKILNSDHEKEVMLNDWMKLDIEEIVLREVTCKRDNVEELLNVLRNDVIGLLGVSFEATDKYGLQVLQKVANFLSELPSRFKGLNPRLYILVASNLMTTCLREISLTSGQSFGAWWIVRCWSDEFMYWCFELGGFLQEEFQGLGFSLEEDFKGYEGSLNQATDSQVNMKTDIIVDLLDGAYGPSSIANDNYSLSMPIDYQNFNMISTIDKLD